MPKTLKLLLAALAWMAARDRVEAARNLIAVALGTLEPRERVALARRVYEQLANPSTPTQTTRLCYCHNYHVPHAPNLRCPGGPS